MRQSPALLPMLAGLLLGGQAACMNSAVVNDTAPGVGSTAAQSDESARAASQQGSEHRGILRLDFNRLAAENFLPLFWRTDADGDGVLDPDELAVLYGYGEDKWSHWIQDGHFTADFEKAWAKLARANSEAPAVKPEDNEQETRQDLVRRELGEGRPTLVESDFREYSAMDRSIVEHVLAAARLVEEIHSKQTGVFGMEERIPADDLASRMLFYRNQGPWCQAAETEMNPLCSAIDPTPERRSGLYPPELQKDPDFCKKLAALPNQESLLTPFSCIRLDEQGKARAVPYNEVYREEMESVAKELEAAAEAINSEDEAALKAYLLAAAGAFRDNNWEPADEAWSRMNVHNSKWYLRVGPDETYGEPCNLKALFHVGFALINQDSLRWQKKLDPLKTDMENALAKKSGAPYEAREVTFHLPDFIDIVLNAGDSRAAIGATIGQSLPNWGPVANEGRGRTVAMTNLYTDKDSEDSFRGQTESVLCSEEMEGLTMDLEPQTMSTVLHEAAHNLGPSHEYRVDGKRDTEIFGGPLASTLEELKAQTAALYFNPWLLERGLITPDFSTLAFKRDVLWGISSMSAGMYTATGHPKPYSQLAAIQIGYLLDADAIRWRPETLAANGNDKGCLAFDIDRFPKAVDDLAVKVFGIKARGDRAAAEELKKKYVDEEGDFKSLRELIRERWLRSSSASFVYSIRM